MTVELEVIFDGTEIRMIRSWVLVLRFGTVG